MTEEKREISSESFPTQFYGMDDVRKQTLVDELKTVFDPEIPVDIYELGLIYRVSTDGDKAHVEMSLTSPGCPVAGEMPGMVEAALLGVTGLTEVKVEIVWDPPWNPDMMSEDAKDYLGF